MNFSAKDLGLSLRVNPPLLRLFSHTRVETIHRLVKHRIPQWHRLIAGGWYGRLHRPRFVDHLTPESHALQFELQSSSYSDSKQFGAPA